MVECPPPRAVLDDFGVDIVPEPPVSPPMSPQEKKPPPRPYIRRSRSSSSAISVGDNALDATSADKVADAQSVAAGVSSPAQPSSPTVQIKAFLSRRLSTASSASKDSD